MLNALSVIASRAAAFLVTMLVAWLGVRYKFEASPAVQKTLTDFLEAVFLAGSLGLATHFGIALKANPLDTVSPTEAKRGRQAKKARKRARTSLEETEARVEQAGADRLSIEEPPPETRHFRPPHDT